ncbi:MAG: MFS transporter [Chloroflexota bacterium]
MATHASPIKTGAGHESSDKAELNIGRGKAYFWLAIITLIYFFDCADRVVVASMFPAIKAEFKLSDFELGLLGNVLGLVMAILVVPMAAFVDKWSRKYMISIMVALWSAMTWACAFAGSFSQLLTFRALVGVGEAAYNPAGYALISAWFPQKMRALAVGIFTAAQPISGVLAMGLGGTLAMMYGWRGVLGIFAVPGLILALIVLFAPDYKTKKVEASGEKVVRPSFWETARYSMSNTTLRLIYISQMFVFFWAGVFTIWLPSFIGRAYGLNMAQAGQMVMIAFGFAIIGPPLGGWFADLLFKRYANGRLLANMILLVIAVVMWTAVFVGAMSGWPLWAVMICWCTAQPCTAGQFGLPVTAALDLTPAHYRGVSQSFIPMVGNFIGFVAAPFVGAMSDRYGLNMALLVTMWIGFGIGLIFVSWAAKTYGADYRKSKELGEFVLSQN